MNSKKKMIVALAVVLAAGGAVAVAHGLHGHGKGGHSHGAASHDHHAPAGSARATEQLKLNAGNKWETDEALRKGMSAIRADVEGAIKPIHSGQFAAADFEKLASGIEARVNEIIATCKLPEETDAQFHLVVADVFAGASTMKAEGDRIAGVVRIIEALDAYGNYFDQPGWTKIAH